MSFLLVLAVTTAICLVAKDALRKAPALFYGLCLVLSAAYAVTSMVAFPRIVQQVLFLLMQKGTLSTALFVVVMYIGVFKDVEVVRRRYLPIRGHLSIMACILILGHVAKYTLAFAPKLSAVAVLTGAGLLLGALCFLLMIPLGVTSLQKVRRVMSIVSWTRLQRYAYLFYGLLYLHVVAMLLPYAGGAGGPTATASVTVYTVVFGLYGVLKGLQWLHSRQRSEQSEPGIEPDAEATWC